MEWRNPTLDVHQSKLLGGLQGAGSPSTALIHGYAPPLTMDNAGPPGEVLCEFHLDPVPGAWGWRVRDWNFFLKLRAWQFLPPLRFLVH